jgi:hypothetical protein
MKKDLLLVSLLLGIAFDILFWKKNPGISFAIFTILCLSSGYLLLRSQNIKPVRMSLVLLGPILFFSVMTFNRLEPFTSLLNYSLTVFCMAIFVMTYRDGLWTSFGFGDYVINLLHLIASMFTSGWMQLTITDAQPDANMGKENQNKLWPILRGLILAIPILFVFGALFSSADLIFAQKLNELLNNLNLEKLGETIFRGGTILLIAYFLIGIFSHAEKRNQNDKNKGRDKPFLVPFLGYTEASIILGSILLLFGAFVIIQFQYFFSGQANISLAGFTYSDYARRGFGELVAVAAFSLIIFQSLNAITKRETNWQKKNFSGLGIGLVLLVIIILISSIKRLYLYEEAYGFSRLRAYSHVFIIWLGILLIAVVVIEVVNRQRAIANVALIILMGFTLSLNVLNIDAFIVHQNIQRAIQGMELDTTYLSAMTNDAVPILVKDYSMGNLIPEIKNEIGAALVCYNEYVNTKYSQTQFWQSFNSSDWNAAREINTIQEVILKYQVVKDTQSIVVISPNGMKTYCRNNYFE